jgi:hypothetical protein
MIETSNFIKKEKFKILYENITSPYFPWYLQKGAVYPGDGHTQFCHTFVQDEKIVSDFMFIIDPVIELLNAKKLLRIKANLLYKSEKTIEHGFHTDMDEGIECTTALLYLNTNNGYTKFKKNGHIIKSEENKFVSFDSSLEHTGSSCTDKDYRIVLNLNYLTNG